MEYAIAEEYPTLCQCRSPDNIGRRAHIPRENLLLAMRMSEGESE